MATNFYATQEWHSIRDSVIKRDGGKCGYCGGTASQADHITARHYSDNDNHENLIAACRHCNRYFNSKVFESYEEKLAYFQKNVLDVWNEYLERARKAELLIGKPLSEKQKRKGRMTMIAEGKFPIQPHKHGFDYQCLTCAAAEPAQKAKKQRWPNESMCPECANDAGVPLVFRKHVATRLIDKYEDLAAQDSTNIEKYRLDLLIKEEKAKAGLTDAEKLQWNIDHADEIEEGMIYRRVCRECGTKVENYDLVEGLPYCKDGEHGRESTYLAPNVDWFIEEKIEKKPKWNEDAGKKRALQKETQPESFLPEEIVKNTKTREERRAWNIEHADWLELSMPMNRVCRCCGRKTGYYDLIEGIVQCVWCQTKDVF